MQMRNFWSAKVFVALMMVLISVGCGSANDKKEAGGSLESLSDEFEDSSTWENWTKATDTRASIEYLSKYDINETSKGGLYLEPINGTWYANNTGHLSYKDVTGDFVATMRVKVAGKSTPIPQGNFDLTGLMARVPNQKEDDTYSSNENWEYLSTGGHALTRIIDYKRNINSDFTYQTAEVTTDWIELRLARVGTDIVKLYKEDGEEWKFLEVSEREDFPETLQVGFCLLTNLDGTSDNFTTIDYVRFHAPVLSDEMKKKAADKTAEEADWLVLLGKD